MWLVHTFLTVVHTFASCIPQLFDFIGYSYLLFRRRRASARQDAPLFYGAFVFTFSIYMKLKYLGVGDRVCDIKNWNNHLRHRWDELLISFCLNIVDYDGIFFNIFFLRRSHKYMFSFKIYANYWCAGVLSFTPLRYIISTPSVPVYRSCAYL
jgi:hypothetical protein